jgi:hypothetical protein
MARKPAPPPAHVQRWFRAQGREGGKASAARLTPEERRAKARAASLARWGKRPEPAEAESAPAEADPGDAYLGIPEPLLDRVDAIGQRMGLSRQSALELVLRAGLTHLGG